MEREFCYSKGEGFTLKKLSNIPAEIKKQKVLIRPLYVGICGSDILQIKSGRDCPCLGHEWVGRVVKSSSQDFEKGELVTTPALIFCGECEQCREGDTNVCQNSELLGGENYNVLKSWCIFHKKYLLKLPSIDPKAAALLEVAAIGDRAISKLHTLPKINAPILIMGGGAVGLMTALSARKQGHEVILVEKTPYRLQAALNLKIEAYSLAEFLINAKNLKNFRNIIDCTGNGGSDGGAMKLIPSFSKLQSNIVIVGKYQPETSFPHAHYSLLSSTITWVTGASKNDLKNTISNWEKEIENISNIIISDTYKVDKINEAFQKAQETQKALKVLIEIQES